MGYATADSRAGGPDAVLREFKGMVKLLHEAGLEVILDVVYNHTSEVETWAAPGRACAASTTAPTTGSTTTAPTST